MVRTAVHADYKMQLLWSSCGSIAKQHALLLC